MTFLQFVRLCGITPTLGQATWIKVAVDRTAKLTKAERACAAELFGGVELADVPSLARDVLVLLKGARIGGSMLSGLYLAWRACTAPLDSLRLGERATALVVGPDLRLARQVLRYARGAFAEVKELESALVADAKDEFVIQRRDGSRVAVEALPATRGGAAERGRSLVAAVMTESAFFRDENGAVNDADIFRAIAPRVATIPGGVILLESTPWLETGLTYELDRDNWTNPTTALVAHAPSVFMRPELAKVVERERLRDPDSAQREFDCAWLGGGASAFFDERTIRDAVDDELPLPSPIPAGELAAIGADVGLVSDSSACAVMSRDREATITLRGLVELKPKKNAPLKLSKVVEAFATVAHAAGVERIMADQHERTAAREYADEHGVRIVKPHNEGHEGKFQTYEAMRRAMREGRLRLPHHPRLIAQLRSVVCKPLPAGGWRIEIPRRQGLGHGDLVSAVTLAHWQIRSDEARARAWRDIFLDGIGGADADSKVGEVSERIERSAAVGFSERQLRRVGLERPIPAPRAPITIAMKPDGTIGLFRPVVQKRTAY